MYYVYILFIKKSGRFYAGQTRDLQKRLLDHNRGASPFTAWKSMGADNFV